jgi:predicted small integral membrane protein
MRRDYEQHLSDCPHCRARQKFHRSLDGTLAVLTALSMISFLFALAVLQRVKLMEHVAFNILHLETVSVYQMLVSAAFAGLGFSLVAFILVLATTPASAYLGGIAMERARTIEARLPESIRSLRPR